MPPWQKPDNALRRASELLEVGRKQDALDTLHDVIKNNRKVRQWNKVFEQIMFKHLELCVELRKPHLAKDGLFQYRNMCQMVNAKSLEDVIQMFLALSEKKAEQARQESQGLVEDVEDLDQAESPEKLLLSAVTGEGTQERADRTILSPWLRFLWEAYRQCLELLRNNMQVETLYHRVAKQAFNFCLKYQRKAEFRKLCDNLRTHLNQIQKAQHHAHYTLKLTNPETLAMHQETRLIQLDIAIQMELWQEAFKSVEDVHQLMQLSKRQARSSALASYYEKLALIFWKANNGLFHAAVLMKLFHLTKELKKSVSTEELANLATRVLLAVLSVNVTGACSDLSRHLEMEETFLENQRKLATLIMLPSPPTRQSLLKDVVRLNVHLIASVTAQNLYKLFETDFSPLSLAVDVEKYISSLIELDKPEQIKYVDRLKEIAAAKILRQVSQVYSTATFTFLCKIIPYYDRAAVERLVVSMGKRFHFQIRLHHRTESVEFGLQDNSGADDFTGLSTGSAGVSSTTLNSQLNVPIVQTMPGEQIRQHLQQMYTALQGASSCVDSAELTGALTDSLRQRIALYGFHKTDQHAAILNRKKQIEMYKETAERIRSDQEEKQKEQERLFNELKRRELNMRLEHEKMERMEQQKRREQEELKQRMMQDRLERMKDPKLRKIIEEMPGGTEFDNDKILERQILHLEQEKREITNKLKQQEKKLDYYIRAMHLEEVPLRKIEYETWAVEDVDYWENYETTRIEKAVEDHKLLIQTVERAKQIKEEANDIMVQIRANRVGDFQHRLAKWEKRLKETRSERLDERRKERKLKRREQWLEEKKEAERKKKDEEDRQRREQEMSGRGFGNRAQGGRRNYDQPQEAGGEPSGADADQWVRGQAPPQRESRYGKRPDSNVPDGQNVDGEVPQRRVPAPQADNWRERAPQSAEGDLRRPAQPREGGAGSYGRLQQQQISRPEESNWRSAPPDQQLPTDYGKRRTTTDHENQLPSAPQSSYEKPAGPTYPIQQTPQRVEGASPAVDDQRRQVYRPPVNRSGGGSYYPQSHVPAPQSDSQLQWRRQTNRDSEPLPPSSDKGPPMRSRMDDGNRALPDNRANGSAGAPFQRSQPPTHTAWKRSDTSAAATAPSQTSGGAPSTGDWRAPAQQPLPNAWNKPQTNRQSEADTASSWRTK